MSAVLHPGSNALEQEVRCQFSWLKITVLYYFFFLFVQFHIWEAVSSSLGYPWTARRADHDLEPLISTLYSKCWFSSCPHHVGLWNRVCWLRQAVLPYPHLIHRLLTSAQALWLRKWATLRPANNNSFCNSRKQGSFTWLYSQRWIRREEVSPLVFTLFLEL